MWYSGASRGVTWRSSASDSLFWHQLLHSGTTEEMRDENRMLNSQYVPGLGLGLSLCHPMSMSRSSSLSVSTSVPMPLSTVPTTSCMSTVLAVCLSTSVCKVSSHEFDSQKFKVTANVPESLHPNLNMTGSSCSRSKLQGLGAEPICPD